MDLRWTPVLPIVAIVGALGCAADETVVARVGGRDIPVQDVQAYIASTTGMPWQAVDRRAVQGLFDQFIDQEVILARAGDDEAGGGSLDPAQRPSRVRSVVAEICGQPPEPAAEAVERELAAAIGVIQPARVRVRQMLLDSLAKAQSARARLEAGESFIDVSIEVSKAANAGQGGELGWIDRGTLPEDLDQVVFSLPEGGISQPVLSPAGYHVLQVLEVVPEGLASRVEMELVVRHKLADALARTFTAQCVAKTATEVGVRVFEDHLWFEYRGRYGEAIDED